MADSDIDSVKKIYKRFCEYYAGREKNNPNRRVLTKTIHSMIIDVKGKNVLDAGCGAGEDSKILAKKGATVIGIDISPDMIKLAKKTCKSNGTKFYVRDMEKTGFKSAKFDIILSILSLMYKRKIDGALSEFRRILKKNGEVVVVVPHPVRKMFKYTGNYFERGKHWERHGKMKYFNYYRTMEDYINNVTSSGFILKEIKEIKSQVKKPTRYLYPCYLILRCVK